MIEPAIPDVYFFLNGLIKAITLTIKVTIKNMIPHILFSV